MYVWKISGFYLNSDGLFWEMRRRAFAKNCTSLTHGQRLRTAFTSQDKSTTVYFAHWMTYNEWVSVSQTIRSRATVESAEHFHQHTNSRCYSCTFSAQVQYKIHIHRIFIAVAVLLLLILGNNIFLQWYFALVLYSYDLIIFFSYYHHQHHHHHYYSIPFLTLYYV